MFTARAKRIGILLSSFKAGGVERITLSLSAMLQARGHEVTLLMCKPEGPLKDELDSTVKVRALKPSANWKGRLAALRAHHGSMLSLVAPVLLPKQPSKSLRFLPDLAHVLRSEPLDALLSSTPHLNVEAIWARELSGASFRVVVCEHNQVSHRLLRRRGWRNRFFAPVMRQVYPKADSIVAVSSGVADELSSFASIPRDRITTVYNPVVTPQLMERSTESLTHPWFSEGEVPVIMTVGRLSEQKDHPTLIRAFAKLRAQCPARLIILGEGETGGKRDEKRESLEALAQQLGVAEDVSLPGFERNPLRYMARARLFVLSSRYEGLPTVLIEALACGCPVVSTDCPGSVEILGAGRFGRIVSVGDVAALAGTMLETLREEPDRGLLRRRAQDFSAEESVAKYEALLLG